MRSPIIRAALFVLVLLIPGLVFGQAKKYMGPTPEQADLPYLLHAENLIPTEKGVAHQSEGKDQLTYQLPGATSKVRTPLPEPIFIMRSEKLIPDKLSLYKLDVKGGQRVLNIPTGKKSRGGPKPIFMMVHRLQGSLYRVEVNEYLPNGEYCLSPDGSNDVYCFTTY